MKENSNQAKESIQDTEKNLKNLLDKITKENKHNEIDFGKPEGKEVF